MVEHNQTLIWINEAQKGNRLAISKLLAAYHPVFRARVEERLEKSLRSKYEPEDILQQVYIEVFSKIDQFEMRNPNSFLNWSLTIVDNKINDIRRAMHRQIRDIAREMHPQSAAIYTDRTQSCLNLIDQLNDTNKATPSKIARQEEAFGALFASLARISEPHQQVIKLRFLQGLSVSEVAERLEKTEPAVIAMTKRALESLHKYMNDMGEFTRG